MRAEAATPVFVPSAFDDPVAIARVVACPVEEGAYLASGEVLARVRSITVDAEIESPLAGRLVRLYVKPGDNVQVGEMIAEIAEQAPPRERASRERPPRQRRPRVREPSGAPAALAERSPLLVALVLAAGALARPIAWLVATFLLVALATSAADVGVGSRRLGPADLIVVPVLVVVSTLRRAGQKIAEIAPLISALMRILLWLAIALVVPAALGGVSWLLTHGTDGLLAAVRLSTFAHAPSVFAFVACLWVLRGWLRRPGPRDWLREVAARPSELTLTAIAVAGALWLVICVAAFERHVWWPSQSFQAFAHRLPTGLRGFVEDQRTSLVTTEARAVVDCLHDRGPADWVRPRVRLRQDGSIQVAVRAKSTHRPTGVTLATLMLALHNQLAPHGATVVITLQTSGEPITFRAHGAVSPVTEVGQVVRGATISNAAPVIVDEITSNALACSAVAV